MPLSTGGRRVPSVAVVVAMVWSSVSILPAGRRHRLLLTPVHSLSLPLSSSSMIASSPTTSIAAWTGRSGSTLSPSRLQVRASFALGMRRSADDGPWLTRVRCPSPALAFPRTVRREMSSSSTEESVSSTASSSEEEGEILPDSPSPADTVNGRIPRGDLTSLDARTVADNLDLVLSHLTSRRASDETLDAARQVASLNERRVRLITERDAALSVRKEQSAIVGKLMRETKGGTEGGDETVALLDKAKELSSEAAAEAAEKEEELGELERGVSSMLASLPNLLDDCVPDGDDDTQNELVEAWGDIDALGKELGWEEDGFEPKWHDDVAAEFDGWKADEAVRISGSRFVALSGPIARLERALSSFFLDLHATEHGYTEVSVPYVVGRSALEGTSQLPKFEEDLFKIDRSSHTCNGEDAFLIPTAEVPLTNMHRESILPDSDLPLSYVALTPCFRAEAGSYGRDTRGLVRTHQFHKVELVKITRPDESESQHELLTKHAQACLEALKLPYRKVRLCSGDIGFSARHCYDLEVWLPGQGVYKEISSCSNTGDFQAKRMGLRYRPSGDLPAASSDGGGGGKNKKKSKKQPKPQLCHTINGSGLAVGRALVAVLENYQMPDGNVMVPEVLRPYMGGKETLK